MVGARVLCREEEQEEGEEYGLEENSRKADGQGTDRDEEDKHRRNAKRIALDILAKTTPDPNLLPAFPIAPHLRLVAR